MLVYQRVVCVGSVDNECNQRIQWYCLRENKQPENLVWKIKFSMWKGPHKFWSVDQIKGCTPNLVGRSEDSGPIGRIQHENLGFT